MSGTVPALLFVLVLNVISLRGNEYYKGHLEPLGNQRPPEQTVHELLFVPRPQEFWEEYVKPHKPVVFRGAAKNSRAYELWSEEYLIQEYGDTIMRLEARAENDHRIPAGESGLLGRDTMRHFMTHYQTMNAYVISQIPQQMEKDIGIPPCLRCGSFERSIQEVHLFLSAKGGKTIIHRDPYSNIHCLFNGTKQWILIDPEQTEDLYQSKDSIYEYGGYSEVDVDAVNLDQFPLMRGIKYGKVILNSGDCIFMPGGYWHQVRSWGYMNTAVSIWFSRFTEFNNKGCESAVIDFTPMNEVMILWRYSGNGDLTQGHLDIYLIQKLLLQWADSSGKIWLQSFVQRFFHSELGDERNPTFEQNAQARGNQFLRTLDTLDRGYVEKEFIENMSIDELKDLTLFFDPPDVSNMEDFEYSHIQADDVQETLETSVDEKGFFDQDVFIKKYTESLGGTLQKAQEIIGKLSLPTDERVSVFYVLHNAPYALDKYFKAPVHDPTFEHLMFKFFQENWKQHDEL